jgi:hypothetical protein
MRPSPPCLAPILLVLVAAAAHADTLAVLVNATGLTWRIETGDRPGPSTTVKLTLRVPGQAPDRTWEDDGKAPCSVIDLAPGTELHFRHDGGPGIPVHRSFEIKAGGGDPMEGFLLFHTDPPQLPWRRDRKVLSGMFYDLGRPNLYRFTRESGVKLVLEPDLDSAPPLLLGCVIL